MKNIEIKKFTTNQCALFALANKIRTAVFVQEQGVPKDLEYDEHDQTAHHYLLYLNNKPIATARWRQTAHGIKLERFAMLPDYRNQGIGTVLLSEVIKDTSKQGVVVYLHAQADAVNYYSRAGFRITGAAFEEAGIMHYPMSLAEVK
ncbi:MAG: GNAT family N-acetyltransferase [Bacteroidales bacterium]|nr:GNAT family N-acetyltransferase [Bacteroidales bacterium]